MSDETADLLRYAKSSRSSRPITRRTKRSFSLSPFFATSVSDRFNRANVVEPNSSRKPTRGLVKKSSIPRMPDP